jgi:cytochrome c5
MDTLWDHTLNGLNAMPAKGTCMNCSDEELRAAMEHMVEAAQ